MVILDHAACRLFVSLVPRAVTSTSLLLTATCTADGDP